MDLNSEKILNISNDDKIYINKNKPDDKWYILPLTNDFYFDEDIIPVLNEKYKQFSKVSDNIFFVGSPHYRWEIIDKGYFSGQKLIVKDLKSQLLNTNQMEKFGEEKGYYVITNKDCLTNLNPAETYIVYLH